MIFARHPRLSLPIMGLLLSMATMPALAHSAASAYTSSSTGLVVPLYSYPTSSDWSTLVAIKQAYPSLPIVAVVNPSDGPGTWQDPNYYRGIKDLQSVGITVLGYIWTNYGSRSLTSAESDISLYSSLLG